MTILPMQVKPDACAVLAMYRVNPVSRRTRSGNTRWTHCRQAYPRFVRQTFHECAAHSIQKSDWARTYYERQLSRGKKYQAAVRALAYKWIRILYRCWKDRLPYVDTRHTEALKGQQLVPAEVVAFQCKKKVAGFHKFSAAKY